MNKPAIIPIRHRPDQDHSSQQFNTARTRLHAGIPIFLTAEPDEETGNACRATCDEDSARNDFKMQKMYQI